MDDHQRKFWENRLGWEAMMGRTIFSWRGAAAPLNYMQVNGLPLITADGSQMIQAGTFQISVNGTVVCQDTSVFTYNNLGGNCTGANITSSFVDLLSGDFQIVFASGHAPANNAVITGTWTNLISADENAAGAAGRNSATSIDFFGDGRFGAMSSVFAKAPGGMTGHISG